MKMARLYLRDLNHDLQEMYKADLKAMGKKEVVKAFEANEDIEIGSIKVWDAKKFKIA